VRGRAQDENSFQDCRGFLHLSDAANATPTALAVKTKPQIKVGRHPGAGKKGANQGGECQAESRQSPYKCNVNLCTKG